MKRRILALLLAVIMVLGVMPTAAFAAEINTSAAPASELAAGQIEIAKASCTEIGIFCDYLPVYYLNVSGNAGATSVVFTDYTAEEIDTIADTNLTEGVPNTNEAPLSALYSTTKDALKDESLWAFDPAYPPSGLGDNLYAYYMCTKESDEFCVIVNVDNTPEFTAAVNGVEIAKEKIEKQEGAYELTLSDPDTWDPVQHTIDLYVVTVPDETAAVDFTFSNACLAYGYDDDKANCTEGTDEYSGGTVGKTTATRSVDKDGDGNIDFVTVQSPYDENNVSIPFYAITFRYEEAWKGEGTAENPYELATPEDLQALYDHVASGKPTEGLYYKLVADITLPDGWKPIGVLIDPSVGHINKGKNLYAFSGTIDGKKADGSGCYTVTVPKGGLPLLAYVKGATVKNLNIYGPRIEGYGLINNMEGVGLSGSAVIIENITLKSGTQTLKSGLVGAVLTNNRFAGVSTSFETTIRNCTIEEGCVIGYNADQSEIGSFAGRLQGTIENCVSHATVKGKDSVGGIIGCRDNSMGNCIVRNCQFDGTVEGSKNVGGIVGSGYTGAFASNAVKITVENCQSAGTVTGTENVGGILGGDEKVVQAWNAYTLKDNSFTGKVSGSKNVGAIIGYYASLNKNDDITGNSYYSNCGADRGIGFVQYVDTSCETHETDSGATYINTANGKPGIGGITKTNQNRTDDPLGADADKLCRAESAPAVATELKVSGDYKTEYITGEALDLSGMVLTLVYSDDSTENIPLENVTVSEFDAQKVGEQELTISFEGLTATLTVQVKNPEVQIKVTISLLGDTTHGDNGTAHTLSGGNLTEWIDPTEYTVSGNATVKDLLDKVLAENNMTCSNPTGNYVESITYNGVTLGQFDNGANSGWMYTINNVHSDLGVSEQQLKEGDVIVFHYTDDYTKETAIGGDPQATVQEVMDKIDAIGEVTAQSAEAIADARQAYDALPEDQQKLVTNYPKLLEAEKAYADLKGNEGLEKIYQSTGDYMETLGTPEVGSIGGEWMAIGLARSDRDVPADYYDKVVAFIKENINDKEQLHKNKSTENSRVILALTAAGYDVTDVDGHNLLAGYTDMAYLKKQGINGPIWALIALDSHDYEIPESSSLTRDAIVQEILNAQLDNGGWALFGEEADPDTTGMALQALAPYYATNAAVKTAVDKAVERLSAIQKDDGGYASWNTANSESCAQVIVALTALGIDPATDARFVKNGRSVIDALASFYVDGGGFKHTADGQRNGMATEQAYYALAAYFRFKDNKTSLYDMSDVTIKVSTKEYVIIEGADSTVKSGDALSIHASGDLAKFVELRMDGKTVDAKNYTLTEGSTILTFKPEYLASLEAGKHEVTLVYTDGNVSTSLTLLAAEKPENPTVPDTPDDPTTGDPTDNPATGDESSIAMYSVIMAGSVICLAALLLMYRKKSRQDEFSE